MPGIEIDLEATQTNIVYMDVAGCGQTAAAIIAGLRARDVWAIDLGPTLIRCVTHLDVDRANCEAAVAAFRDLWHNLVT